MHGLADRAKTTAFLPISNLRPNSPQSPAPDTEPMAQRPSTRHAPSPPHRLEAASALAGPAQGVAQSWMRQSGSFRVLRAFLGATFVYAGIQKLADPNFLHAGTFDYIGTQLKSFAE